MSASEGRADETKRGARLARIWEKETTADRDRIAAYLRHRGLPLEVLVHADNPSRSELHRPHLPASHRPALWSQEKGSIMNTITQEPATGRPARPSLLHDHSIRRKVRDQ